MKFFIFSQRSKSRRDALTSYKTQISVKNLKLTTLDYLPLAGIILLGAVLRFWHLDLKPLWLDEVITALFSLGRSYNDVPLDVFFPLSTVKEIFTFNQAATCPQIANTVATQSTHPPLFFCLMHGWLNWISPLNASWVWKLRSLPALFGIAAIAVIYFLNRIAFSPTAGLLGAAFIAFSPFGVYLSQEARHYTLPILLISLALLGLILIQHNLKNQQYPKPFIWLAWVIVNSIGFYVHYFFSFSFIAQIITLIGLVYKSRIKNKISVVFLSFALCLLPFALFIPWLSVLKGHMGSSETNWLPQSPSIAPLYQTIAGWLLMAIALPIESQPLEIAILNALLMVVFGSWLGWHFFKGIKKLWNTPTTHLATFTLASFILWVHLEFLAIIYLLGKDITVASRYNFVYYPAACALLGASLWKLKVKRQKAKKGKKDFTVYFIIFLVSLLSCVCVVSNLAFQKPYNPQQVADNMNIQPAVPMMVVVGYNNSQDVALGLSFALALEKIRASVNTENTYFAFMHSAAGYQSIWEKLSQIQMPLKSPLNLWVVAPELKRANYPQNLTFLGQPTCTIDPAQHYRVGIPYQLYRCL